MVSKYYNYSDMDLKLFKVLMETFVRARNQSFIHSFINESILIWN
jgi:hypothetical protein